MVGVEVRVGLGLVLAIAGLFLSAWIVLPPPNFFFLRLAVGAPEVSPWLIGLQAIALLLLLTTYSTSWLKPVALACVAIALVLSTLPLVQLPQLIRKADQAMIQSGIPAQSLERGRSRPFVFWDVFRGIAIAPTRPAQVIQFANPQGEPLAMNVYQPLPPGDQPAGTKSKYPAVIVIHGGGWQGGRPGDNAAVSRYLAAQGYTVLAITYRLAPRHRFPAQLEDVRAAIAYIRQHADDLEVDVSRMALMGRSAGAHLAMLAGYEDVLNAPPLRGVVNYYGPVDLTEGYYDPPKPDPIDTIRLLEDLLGGTPKELSELYKLASPLTFARAGVPPSLLIYGGRDHVVQAKFGRGLAERLRQTGNVAMFLEIPWAEHAFDAIFPGVSNQVALYYTERFLHWVLRDS
jgi:acetyl esterase/lipase